ncbi:MAG: response regulator, partial [bacterium]|nr:response regulator [bacterium]
MARILVIDDEEPIQLAVQAMLGKENHEILTASNGEIGLELLRTEPFDLIITDILMPEKGGIEVIAEIQKT